MVTAGQAERSFAAGGLDRAALDYSAQVKNDRKQRSSAQ